MDKKETIRKAAIKIIAREGFFNTKMQTIADEAGIAVGTIYNYFKSKEEILDYIFAYEHSKRLELVEKCIASELPLKEALEELITVHINRIKDDPYVAKVLIQEELAPLISCREAIQETFVKLKSAMEQLIMKGRKEGVISKEYNTKFLTEIIFYTFRSLTVAICDSKNGVDLEDAKKQAISYIMNGLKYKI